MFRLFYQERSFYFYIIYLHRLDTHIYGYIYIYVDLFVCYFLVISLHMNGYFTRIPMCLYRDHARKAFARIDTKIGGKSLVYKFELWALCRTTGTINRATGKKHKFVTKITQIPT